jgi:hypothetical protein
MKEKHADMFPLCLPDTVDLPDDILHHIRLKDPHLSLVAVNTNQQERTWSPGSKFWMII